MTRGYIRYRGDYKYQLASEYRIKITIIPTEDISAEFIDLTVDGELKIKKLLRVGRTVRTCNRH